MFVAPALLETFPRRDGSDEGVSLVLLAQGAHGRQPIAIAEHGPTRISQRREKRLRMRLGGREPGNRCRMSCRNVAPWTSAAPRSEFAASVEPRSVAHSFAGCSSVGQLLAPCARGTTMSCTE